MRMHPLKGMQGKKAPWTFFLLVFALSIPFWILGPIAEQFVPQDMQTNLPVSSLMVICPLLAAVVLVRREQGVGAAKGLLLRAFDYKRIKRKAWYIPIFCFMPAVMVLQYGLVNLKGGSLPAPQIPVLMVGFFFALFFVAALAEEVGWQGYAIDPLQGRWNALAAGVILGSVWAIWHILPLIQLGRPADWIVWQCLSLVMVRILVVWLYNNTGKSVSAAILFHATINVTTVLLPNYGWPYDPFFAFVITTAAAAMVVFLWGPATLARYRYARRGEKSRQVQQVSLVTIRFRVGPRRGMLQPTRQVAH